MEVNKIIQGDCLSVLKTLPDQSVNCCITSPPYWGLRDYGVDGQLGLEKTPEEYVAHMVGVFREVRRVLRDDGTLWLNLGDTYSSSGAKGSGGQRGKQATNVGSYFKDIAERGRDTEGLEPKNLVGIPWRVAFALQSDGWYLRQDIIWAKPNPMPESVTDRCTKAHEYIFLLAKNGDTIIWRAKDTGEWSHKPNLSEIVGHDKNGKPIPRWRGFSYYYDGDAIKEPSLNGYRGTDFMPTSKKDLASNHDTFATAASMNNRTDEIIENRNRRSVWTVTTKPFREAHFATFPPDLIEPCALAGCPENGIILDPFMGAGTTGVVAKTNYRNYIGIELNEKYIEIAQKRIDGTIVNKKLDFGGEDETI